MLRKLYTILFFLGLFFFPFNEYEGIPFLGEFKSEAGALFLMLGFLFLLLEVVVTKRIFVPYKSPIFQIGAIFLIWCFISTLLNVVSVSTNYFKHTGGINRFIRQYFALLISGCFFLILYCNVFIKMDLKEILFKIRKAFFYSLVIASIYGFLEILVSYFGINSVFPVLKLFDYFPFLEVKIAGLGRISSIAYEPPFLAIYLITIAGWMFSYILTEKGIWKFFPTIAILLLTFFSGSRTGLIVVFFQLFIFTTILYKDKRFKVYVVYSLIGFFALFSVMLIFNGEKVTKALTEKVESLDFQGNLKNNISNKSRFGMQYASLQVFKENPIVGVGFGQQTYHSRTHYPTWATKDNYEFDLIYKNKNVKSFPPGYNLYTRLLAETGIIGFLILLALIYYSIKQTKIFIKNSSGEKQILSYILLISFSGLFINWLQIDTFRIYGIWLSLAILMRLSQEKITINE
ncbi:O-antigen ligase family protein [Flavobacterium sp. GT3P67]|nr:O-antigen ligase family protein [Flavobacterium sp. GT3P67]